MRPTAPLSIETAQRSPRSTHRGSRARRVAASAGRLALTLALGATAIQLLQACSFVAPDDFKTAEGLYRILDTSPYADDATVTESRWPVIDAAKLKVHHGQTCASAPRAASEEYVGMRVYGTATLPNANWKGTVLLNGWYLEYQNGDHHLGGLGSVIFNVAQVGNELSWDAGGVLSDKNGDDAYVWCYHYTLLAWAKDMTRPGQVPKERVDMNAIHADASGKLAFVKGDRSSSGAKKRMAAKFTTVGPPPAAKLLAGFGAGFEDNDHHLLQFGFDLGKTRVRGQKIKWNTDVILHDNKTTREYYASHLATILTGESVHVWKPASVLMETGHPKAPGFIDNDLKLEPYGPVNVCLGGESSSTYTFKITGVPFTWAVPMLTGWQVGDFCNDEHVKKIGAWIEDFAWDRKPGESTGTLTYTVRTINQDKSPFAPILDRMQVEVLGVNLLQPPGNA
jgi:hypothetical protein